MKSFVAALGIASANALFSKKYSNLAAQQGNGFSTIQMQVNGVSKTYYVAAPFASAGGANYKVPSNGRGYISESPTLDYNNPDYFRPNLLGGYVEYDVDLSHHECGCIAALYLVGMPGKHADGSLWMNTDNWGYCDANKVDGNWCPEFDIMEANKWSWATTPHKCDPPTSKGFYNSCDQGGTCAKNISTDLEYSAYGPGDGYTINTSKPFHAKIQFDSKNNQFSSFTTTFSQNGKTKSMTSECSYLNNMTNDIANGMGFVVSNWGGNASWLWHDRCSGSCNWPELTVSNIKIKTGSVKPGPGPSPTPFNPSNYNFGDLCAGVADYCGSEGCGANHCKWSWPKNDPLQWSSKDAACRCEVI